MRRISDIVSEKAWVGWLLFIGTLVAVFLIGLLGASIIERRQEAFITQQVKPLPEWEPRNEVWGQNFPREFERYEMTAKTDFFSRYGGSGKIDLLERNPQNVVMWAGYAFSREYLQARGHYHAITDIRDTLRTMVPQPGTCWTCKSTDVPRLMNEIGVAEFYKKTWKELGPQVVNHIGCQDCHDPKTMNLRITRPALAEAWQRRGLDITKPRTRRCARLFARSATSSITSGARANISPFRGTRASPPKRWKPTTMKSATSIGCMRSARLRCSKRSIPITKPTAQGFIPSEAFRAPIATCLIATRAA